MTRQLVISSSNNKFSSTILAAAFLALTVTACVGKKSVPVSGEVNPNYERYLEEGYQEIARERGHAGRLKEAVQFSSKSHARKKYILEPKYSYKDAPRQYQSEIRAAEDTLYTVKNLGGETVLPKATAALQVAYDCWVAGLIDRPNHADTKLCKKDFYRISDNIFDTFGEVTIGDVNMVTRYDVYFGFNQSGIDSGIREDLVSYLHKYRADVADKIILTGHADTKGNPDYNRRIAASRLNTVKDVITSQGISAAKIITRNYGQDLPLVVTSDDTKEARNRVVRIMVVHSNKNR